MISHPKFHESYSLIGVIGFIGTPGNAGLLVVGVCEGNVTGSSIRHYTSSAFSPILPITPIIPMFAFSQTDYIFLSCRHRWLGHTDTAELRELLRMSANNDR